MEITQEFIKSILDYKDGFLYWKIKKGKKINIGDLAGSSKGESRHRVKINYKLYTASRLIFLWHKGFLPKEVDHIDRNPLNDKIENLREATRSQNNCNRDSYKDSTSKYVGVSFFNGKRFKGWRASLKKDYKTRYSKTFKTQEEAALAYNREAVRYHGEFANLNIINNVIAA